MNSIHAKLSQSGAQKRSEIRKLLNTWTTSLNSAFSNWEVYTKIQVNNDTGVQRLEGVDHINALYESKLNPSVGGKVNIKTCLCNNSGK